MKFENFKTKKENILFLAFGMLSMSQAGVLIKLAHASVYSVAFYRVFFAGLILLFFYFKEIFESFKVLKFNDYFLFLVAGLLLSLHFLTWNYSFTMINVAEATLVIASSPIFISLGAFWFFKEKPNKNFYPSFVLSFIGLILVSYSGIKNADGNFLGILSVFTSTIFFVFYFLIGKLIRKKVNTQIYLFNLYMSSAFFSFLFYIFLEDNFTHSFNNYSYFVLLAIFPTLIGHGSVNHVISFFKASTVSMNQLVQPVFATVVAYFLLDEPILFTSLLGYFFISIGVLILLRGVKNA